LLEQNLSGGRLEAGYVGVLEDGSEVDNCRMS
jgi:hypothetical protein